MQTRTAMADRGGRAPGAGVKPVPMKLFATWEVEKSTPNCIPRLCNLTLTRLVIVKNLENELQSVIIAVKMQNSKRILRSNEIIMAPNGLLDTELDLSFSLQYPHFLKRDGNKLQVMIQRRKKYKNRTILGYKTLAIGQVNMAQVLQRSVDRELSLYSDLKERTNVVAQVMMLSLSSQPVDHEENGRRKLPATEADRSPDVDVTDDDAEDPEFSSNEEMSDSEPIPGEEDRPTRPRKFLRGPSRPTFTRQRNIKQKFIALLRRFRVSEEVLDSEQDQDPGDQEGNHQADIDDLFDELENLSESDPEMDTLSVLSTPKPKLRPFFTGKGSTEILDVPKDSGRLSDDSSSRKYDSDTHLSYNETPKSYNTFPLRGSAGRRNHKIDKLENVSDPELSDSLNVASSSTLKHEGPEPQDNEKHPRPKSPTHTAKLKRDRSTSFKEAKAQTSRPKERRNSVGNAECLVTEPRKVLLEQLGAVLASDEYLPESIILVNTNEWQGQLLSQVLQDPNHRVVCTCSAADVKATLSFVVNKIQKLRHGGNFMYSDRNKGCNCNSRAPSTIKIAVAGGDGYINSVVRPYVEQFSSKSPDWQQYLKFLVIPLGASSVGKFLSLVDGKYNAYFNDSVWKDTFEKTENSSRSDMGEIIKRITSYVSGASQTVQLPIAEAMLTYKEKNTDEESSQIFVPFVNEVRIGPIDVLSGVTMASTSGSSSTDPAPPHPLPTTTTIPHTSTHATTTHTQLDLEESPLPAPHGLSSSPPQSSSQLDKARDNHTPPQSPNVSQPASTPSSHHGSTLTSPAGGSPPEVVDLQLDYWTVPANKQEISDKFDKLVKKDSKSSLKTTFRSVQVYRLPQGPISSLELSHTTLNMIVVTKEKKQKIMRIGKKSKDSESKSQAIEGINRLICTSKQQTHPLTVCIDGVEWMGVKFFQLSAQWQTHIRHFPILTFNPNNSTL